MRDDARLARQLEIEESAYALLEENGYAGMSMLAVAQRARASNETLYRWYGDKPGLFKAMVARNAGEVRALLEASFDAGQAPFDTLAALGPVLLGVLTGKRAVALNRAAAADASGTLGVAIAEAGRDSVMPLIVQVMKRAREAGELGALVPSEAAEVYISLLIGDTQIRRAIGVLKPLSKPQIQTRATRAVTLLRKVG